MAIMFLRCVLYVSLYIVVVCASDVVGLEAGKQVPLPRAETEDGGGGGGGGGGGTRACAPCPRRGRCVAPVQCPAHVRPTAGARGPGCHLAHGVPGVCCATGSRHAAEAELKARAAAPAPVAAEEVQGAHRAARRRLAAWLDAAAQMLKEAHVLNSTSPSFGHHLSGARWDARAAELGRGALLNMFAAQELRRRRAVADDDLALGLAGHVDGPFCRPPVACPAPQARFRSFDGECNNLQFPTWGAAHSEYERLLPPDYSDGIWGMRASSTGLPLPSARLVSHRLLLDADRPSRSHNLMFSQFGQFIAHDLSAAVVFTLGNGSALECCAGAAAGAAAAAAARSAACAPVAVEADDPFYGAFGRDCLNFVRAQLAPAYDCSIGYAKQMNGVSHFADLSQLYGGSEQKAARLRGPRGMLATLDDYGRELPPLTQRKECLTTNEGSACFDSGDGHGNQVIALTTLHAVFTREHNRVARALARLNPGWSPDRLYLEARRLLQAQYQHIVYNEWLPLLLGPTMTEVFGLAGGAGGATYDAAVNAALTTEFAAAAMRFGHSTVDGHLLVTGGGGAVHELAWLPELMFRPGRLRLRRFLDGALAGLGAQPMQAVDPFVSETLTRYLFHGGQPFGLDLAAINVQRGRDYGVRGYPHYRRLAGLSPRSRFDHYPPTAAERLAAVYARPEDVDLWVGALLEAPAAGGVVGATFANIIADQFARLRRGDRYFYEHGPDVNPGAFSPSQLAEIKKATLARIICDNKDGYEEFLQPPNAFLRADLPGNEPVPCDSPLIPELDLSRFREV